MFIIYTYVEPGKKLYLQSCDLNGLKNMVCDTFRRFLDNQKSFNINFDISFTDDIRKAEKFVTRDVALKCVEILNGLIPENFSIESV